MDHCNALLSSGIDIQYTAYWLVEAIQRLAGHVEEVDNNVLIYGRTGILAMHLRREGVGT